MKAFVPNVLRAPLIVYEVAIRQAGHFDVEAVRDFIPNRVALTKTVLTAVVDIKHRNRMLLIKLIIYLR